MNNSVMVNSAFIRCFLILLEIRTPLPRAQSFA
jgi:hypothetical protein